MLLNEIKLDDQKTLKNLKWADLAEIIGRADGDRPANDGNVQVRFVKASLPPKAGMWQGWGFIYRFVFKDVNGEEQDEEWVVHVNKEGELDIRAL